jgi:hypothetical protein
VLIGVVARNSSCRVRCNGRDSKGIKGLICDVAKGGDAAASDFNVRCNGEQSVGAAPRGCVIIRRDSATLFTWLTLHPDALRNPGHALKAQRTSHMHREG